MILLLNIWGYGVAVISCFFLFCLLNSDTYFGFWCCHQFLTAYIYLTNRKYHFCCAIILVLKIFSLDPYLLYVANILRFSIILNFIYYEIRVWIFLPGRWETSFIYFLFTRKTKRKWAISIGNRLSKILSRNYRLNIRFDWQFFFMVLLVLTEWWALHKSFFAILYHLILFLAMAPDFIRFTFLLCFHLTLFFSFCLTCAMLYFVV